jgi:hypothetical protein
MKRISKKIYDGQGFNTGHIRLELNTTSSAKCDICGNEMIKKGNVKGYRTITAAKQAYFSGDKNSTLSLYDSFTCPNIEKKWHKQVIAIIKFAKNIPSRILFEMLLKEAEEIVKNKKETKAGYDFEWMHY